MTQKTAWVSTMQELADLARTHGDLTVVQVINGVADRMKVEDRICVECRRPTLYRGAWADDRGFLCPECGAAGLQKARGDATLCTWCGKPVSHDETIHDLLDRPYHQECKIEAKHHFLGEE